MGKHGPEVVAESTEFRCYPQMTGRTVSCNKRGELEKPALILKSGHTRRRALELSPLTDGGGDET